MYKIYKKNDSKKRAEVKWHQFHQSLREFTTNIQTIPIRKKIQIEIDINNNQKSSLKLINWLNLSNVKKILTFHRHNQNPKRRETEPKPIPTTFRIAKTHQTFETYQPFRTSSHRSSTMTTPDGTYTSPHTRKRQSLAQRTHLTFSCRRAVEKTNSRSSKRFVAPMSAAIWKFEPLHVFGTRTGRALSIVVTVT